MCIASRLIVAILSVLFCAPQVFAQAGLPNTLPYPLPYPMMCGVGAPRYLDAETRVSTVLDALGGEDLVVRDTVVTGAGFAGPVAYFHKPTGHAVVWLDSRNLGHDASEYVGRMAGDSERLEFLGQQFFSRGGPSLRLKQLVALRPDAHLLAQLVKYQPQPGEHYRQLTQTRRLALGELVLDFLRPKTLKYSSPIGLYVRQTFLQAAAALAETAPNGHPGLLSSWALALTEKQLEGTLSDEALTYHWVNVGLRPLLAGAPEGGWLAHAQTAVQHYHDTHWTEAELLLLAQLPEASMLVLSARDPRWITGRPGEHGLAETDDLVLRQAAMQALAAALSPNG